jgi:hypothetical protein
MDKNINVLPLEFKLGGKDYTVELVESIDDTGLGRSYAMLGKIKLALKYQGFDIPADQLEQTFYHELVHVILTELGEERLNSNETFVQSFSLLLHQFIKQLK